MRSRGFTLVELMIALVIIAILTALAFPTVSAAMAEGRLRAAMNEIRFDLGEARARATERNVAVVLVLTSPGLAVGGTLSLWESTSRSCADADTSLVPLIGPIDLAADATWKDTGLVEITMNGADQGASMTLCIRPDGGVYKGPAPYSPITGPVRFNFRRFESGSPVGVERIVRVNFNGLPRIER